MSKILFFQGRNFLDYVYIPYYPKQLPAGCLFFPAIFSPATKRDTIDMERFAGLNLHGFSPIKVIAEILSRCLGQKFSLFSTIKERCYIYGKLLQYS